jgi:hypothetical protein
MMPEEDENGALTLLGAQRGGTSQNTKRVRASDSHELESAKGAITQLNERVRLGGRHSHTGNRQMKRQVRRAKGSKSEEHSQTGEYRGKNKVRSDRT